MIAARHRNDGRADGSLLGTIEGGPLDSAYAQMKGGAMIERSFEPSFSLSLALKDAGLVLEAAERPQQEVPLTQVVQQQMKKAEDAGHGEEDMAATYWASAPAPGRGPS